MKQKKLPPIDLVVKRFADVGVNKRQLSLALGRDQSWIRVCVMRKRLPLTSRGESIVEPLLQFAKSKNTSFTHRELIEGGVP